MTCWGFSGGCHAVQRHEANSDVTAFSLDPDLKLRTNISSAPLHIYDLVAAQVCCRCASNLAPAAAFVPRLMVDQLACIVCRAQTAAKYSGPEYCTLDSGSPNGVCSISIRPHFIKPAKTWLLPSEKDAGHWGMQMGPTVLYAVVWCQSGNFCRRVSCQICIPRLPRLSCSSAGKSSTPPTVVLGWR